MKLSLQLFSARNYTPYTDVIARLGDYGFDCAEGFFGNFAEADATRAALDAAGLTMPTLHVPLQMLEEDAAGVAALCKTLGTQAVYAPWIAPEMRGSTSAEWEALADRLAACHTAMAEFGIPLGWHNHDFEMVTLADGGVPMDILLTRAPMIDWEMDVAWVVRGGADPIEWINKYAGRITAAHFKDIAPAGEKTDEDGWADPGTGTVDWPAILTALRDKTRCAVLVAEHDNPNDFDRFAKQAIAHYRSL